MIYERKESKINGVYKLTLNTFKDDRGSISKIFHKPSFLQLGLDCDFTETLVTTNYDKGVIRGFHYQEPPFAQNKTLFAANGGFINLVLDLRVGSPTYGDFDYFEMDSEKNQILYVPAGVANCYCITQPNTIIVYNLTSKYSPEHAKGVRYDSVGFKFPFDNPILSEKDLSLPYLDDIKSPFIFEK